jgi:hypothetical protein
MYDKTKDDFKMSIKKDAGNSFGPTVKDHCLEYISKKQRVQIPQTLSFKT